MELEGETEEEKQRRFKMTTNNKKENSMKERKEWLGKEEKIEF